MAYVSTVNDPKIVSVQSFRTANSIFVRITSKAIHGYGRVIGYAFKNSIITSYVKSSKSSSKSTVDITIVELDPEVANRTSSSILTLDFDSKDTYDVQVYFNVSKIPVIYSDLQFADYFSEGSSDNTYDYDFSIQHSSSTLKNALRTFIYPSSTKDPSSFLNPTTKANQYYISNTATALYVASSRLQNAYYTSIKTGPLDVNKNSRGKFIGGNPIQEINFTCSTGAKGDNTNVIKGSIIALNLKPIKSSSPTYSVCTQNTASNYHRDSPYTTCDGEELSLSIINDTSNVFVEGGCCNTTRSTDRFNLTAEVKNPTDEAPSGGEITFAWEGGTPPYDLTFGCPSNDPTCVSVSITDTAALSHKITGLSGSTRIYGVVLVDKVGANISKQITVNPAPLSQPMSHCADSTALNYQSGMPSELALAANCRWCAGATGLIATTLNDTIGLDGSNFVTVTSSASQVTASFSNTDGEVGLTWSWNGVSQGNYNFTYSDSTLFNDGNGTEKWAIHRKTITPTQYGSYLSASISGVLNIWSTGTDSQTFYQTSLTTLSYTDSGLSPGIYLYKIQYSDTSGAIELTDCSSYAVSVVQFTACTDATADNFNNAFTTDPALITADNSLCVYSSDVDFPAALEALELITSVQSISNEPCSFKINFMFQGGVAIPSWDNEPYTTPQNIDANSYGLPAQILQIAANAYSMPLSDLSLGNFAFAASFLSASGGSIETIVQSWSSTGWVSGGTTSQVIAFGTDSSNATLNVGVHIMTMIFPIYTSEALGGTFLETAELSWPVWLNPFAALSSEGLLETYTSDALCADCETGGDSVAGCTTVNACNYNSAALIDDGTCVNQALALINYSDGYVSVEIDGTTVVGNPCACGDPNTLDYDPVATYYTAQNGGTPYMYATGPALCGPALVFGCTDSSYNEYNPLANQDDGSCLNTTINGCTDSSACNYNVLANTDDGSCYEVATGCDAYGEWSISSYLPPNTCSGETDGANGSLTIINPDYYGPVSVAAIGAANWVNVSGLPATSSGYSPDGSVTSTDGTFLNTDAGFSSTILITQHPDLGTAITFGNVTVGSFGLYISYSIAPNIYAMSQEILDSCSCSYDGLTNADSFEHVTLTGGYVNLAAPTGERRDGSTGPCGCMDEAADSYSPTATVHTPSACQYYGCTDPEAANYLDIASINCTDPANQSYDGDNCSPCVYGFIDSMYTPAFCMPTKVEHQIEVIRKCIGTAGTTAYINTVTGMKDCALKDAWRLILIEYLMSKTGLDCVYNCADPATPDLSGFKSCSARMNAGDFVGNLADKMDPTSNVPRLFYIGDGIKLRRSGADSPSMYILQSLPGGDQSLSVYREGYVGEGENNYIQYSPVHSTGARYWKLCEEPPSKPSTVNYIGKFTTFVQDFCRQCQIPVTVEQAALTPEIESVVTVNGIVITVNNSELK